jgi:hypothetical protein
MEANRHIYDEKCVELPIEEQQKSFNLYTHDQIEYNFDIHTGRIVLYTEDFDYTFLVTKLTELLSDMGRTRRFIPCNISSSSKNSNYTKIVQSCNSADRVFVKTEKLLRTYSVSKLYKFVWHVVEYTSINTINIPELSVHKNVNKEYLFNSVSTIIYDKLNIFDITGNIMQLNYPTLEQFTAYKLGKVVESSVVISGTFGLGVEILKHYMSSVKIPYDIYNNVQYTRVELNDFKTFDTFNLQPINIELNWESQINNINHTRADICQSSDYNLSTNICFISHMPLYGYVVVIELGIKNPDGSFKNIKHIAISEVVYILWQLNSKFSAYFRKTIKIISAFAINIRHFYNNSNNNNNDNNNK